MEEELEQIEEQNEEVVDNGVSTSDIVSLASDTVVVSPMASLDETAYTPHEDTTTYVGDDETTSNDSDSKEDTSDDKWGSLDCRSECKYNTGDTSKYANYGYSD